MDKNTNSFTMMFSIGMCVVLAVALAGSFAALRDRADANVLFDQQVNVLIATGLHSRWADAEPKDRARLESDYAEFIRPKVLEVLATGTKMVRVKEAGVERDVEVPEFDVVETDIALDQLTAVRREETKKAKAQRRTFTTIYTRVAEKKDDPATEQPVAYCIPIAGPGLWGQIYGYLALEADLRTVRGITFFLHKETPGLGGEIDKEWWQRQWPGKTIADEDGTFTSVAVRKGKVDPTSPSAGHEVDGLSGATITSRGVSNFVRADLERYAPYFAKLRAH